MSDKSKSSNKYPIRIGYACLNSSLREADIFTSRSLILSTARLKGPEYINELIKNNVEDLFKLIVYNEAHGIRFFRITSCLFPHLGNPQLSESDYDISFVKKRLREIGKYAKVHGHRLTMHPGQFAQLGSPHEEVVKQSFVDLINHAKLLKMMGYTPADGSVLIIHGGGTFGNKAETLERWEKNYLSLPKDIREYISLENDENSYGVMDILPFCEKTGIPMCLDIFHNEVSKDRVPITKGLMHRIIQTWKRKQLIPKIHVSEQEPGLRRGAHSKTINRLPIYLFRIPKMFQTPLDIMLEVKDKEISVFKIYYKYFDITMDINGRVDYQMKDKLIKIL